MPSFSIDINKSSCFARIAEKEEEAFRVLEFWRKGERKLKPFQTKKQHKTTTREKDKHT
jgi:hypothetical protein